MEHVHLPRIWRHQEEFVVGWEGDRLQMRGEEASVADAKEDELVEGAFAFRISDEFHDGDSITIFIARSNQLAIRTEAELLTVDEELLAVSGNQFSIATALLRKHAYFLLCYQFRVELVIMQA